MNRTIIITVATLVIIGILGAVYFLFFRTSVPGVVITDSEVTFGVSSTPASLPNTEVKTGTNIPTVEEVAPRFTKIFTGPVAHGVLLLSTSTDLILTTETGTTTTIRGGGIGTDVRFIERTTGNMYSYQTLGNRVVRINNQTIPGVVETVWTLDGTRAFVRYLTSDTEDKIQTYALGTEGIDGYFLEEGLSQVFITAQNKLVTLLTSDTGSIATLVQPDGTTIKTLFSSPLTELRLMSSGSDFIAYNKASSGTGGYVFSIDGASGVFERLLGPVTGLTALASPTGEKILVGYRSGNSLALALFDIASRSSTALPIATFPEKCVWSKEETEIYCAVPRALSSTLPDAWYQGAVSFSDRLWKIDVENRLASLMFDPSKTAMVDIDAVSLSIDELSRVLVFTNKTDGSLWLYEL